MKHVYIEGIECEVSESYAKERVARGEWEPCKAGHNFKKDYANPVTVYHRVHKQTFPREGVK